VRERGGTPFRQIFWSGNGAPANIVGHRWNANTEAFWQIRSYVRLTLDQFIFWPKLPSNAGFGIKNVKKISGGNTPGPSAGGDDPLPHQLQHGYTPCAGGRKLPRCLDLGLGNRPPNQNLPLHP